VIETMDLDDPIALALAIAEALRGRVVPHALYDGLLLAVCGGSRTAEEVGRADLLARIIREG
jgi:hypothetical protein